MEIQKKRIVREKSRKENVGISTYDFIYIVLFCILAFCILTFFYTDFMDTLDNSILFVECIAKGKFLDFYQYYSIHHYSS